MELLDIARYARVCALGGDLGLRHGVGGLPPGEGAQLPGLPPPCSDVLPVVLPDREWVESVRQYVRSWKSILAENASNAESLRAELEVGIEEAKTSLERITQGSDAFVESDSGVLGAHQAHADAQRDLKAQEAHLQQELEGQKQKLAQLTEQLEVARKLSDEDFLKQEYATPAIVELQRHLQTFPAKSEELELDRSLLKKPFLFGRDEYRRAIAELEDRRASLETDREGAEAALVSACGDARAWNINAVELALEEVRSELEDLQVLDELTAVRVAAEAAVVGVDEARGAARSRFQALVKDEAALRDRISRAEEDRAALDAKTQGDEANPERLELLLSLAYAGLATGAIAAVRDRLDAGADVGGLVKALQSCGLTDLISAPDFKALRDIWLDRCPDLMDECFCTIGGLTLEFLKNLSKQDEDLASMVRPLLRLVGERGFVDRAACSAAFFKAVGDMFASEGFRTQDNKYLQLMVASLYAGEKWAETHRPDLKGALEEVAVELVEGITGQSPRSHGGMQRMFADAKRTGFRALGSSGSLG